MLLLARALRRAPYDTPELRPWSRRTVPLTMHHGFKNLYEKIERDFWRKRVTVKMKEMYAHPYIAPDPGTNGKQAWLNEKTEPWSWSRSSHSPKPEDKGSEYSKQYGPSSLDEQAQEFDSKSRHRRHHHESPHHAHTREYSDRSESGNAHDSSSFWRRSTELQLLRDEMLEAAKPQPESRLFRTFDMNAFADEDVEAGTKLGGNIKTTPEDSGTKFASILTSAGPADMPPSRPVNGMVELGTYLAASSYIVSLGGPPLADLRYGIIIVPAGDEGLLFTGYGNQAVMTSDFKAEILAKSKAAQKEQEEELRQNAWDELLKGPCFEPEIDDDDCEFYRRRWHERNGIPYTPRKNKPFSGDGQHLNGGKGSGPNHSASVANSARQSEHGSSVNRGKKSRESSARRLDYLSSENQFTQIEAQNQGRESIAKTNGSSTRSRPYSRDQVSRQGRMSTQEQTSNHRKTSIHIPISEREHGSRRKGLVTKDRKSSASSHASDSRANDGHTCNDRAGSDVEVGGCGAEDSKRGDDRRSGLSCAVGQLPVTASSDSTPITQDSSKAERPISFEACRTLEHFLKGERRRLDAGRLMNSLLPFRPKQLKLEQNGSVAVLLEVADALRNLANGDLHENPGVNRQVWEAAQNKFAWKGEGVLN
jgi:hypothetical protein